VTGYFGTDASQYHARSPITFASKNGVRVLLGRAENDPWFLVRTAGDLSAELCKSSSGCPRLVVLPYHNHYSTAAAFNTADEQMGLEILKFVRKSK